MISNQLMCITKSNLFFIPTIPSLILIMMESRKYMERGHNLIMACKLCKHRISKDFVDSTKAELFK